MGLVSLTSCIYALRAAYDQDPPGRHVLKGYNDRFHDGGFEASRLFQYEGCSVFVSPGSTSCLLAARPLLSPFHPFTTNR